MWFGKTGSTSDDKDRCFIGGTPEYVVGVWYGYDIPKEIVYNYSYNPCGTIWNLVMNNIYDKKGIQKDEFDTPEGVVQREYSYSNGLLCRGTGNWGWFDENNLPGTTTYTGVEKEPTEETTGYGGDEEESTTSKPEETTKVEETTNAPETTTKPQNTTEKTTAGDGNGEE